MKQFKKIILLLIIMFTVVLTGVSQRLHYEIYYQNAFAEIVDGVTEVYLSDRTRVDILIDDYAIEVDFANKWAEGIGQALFYAKMTDKKPGVLLIMEKPDKDEKYLKRLIKVAADYDIMVWVIDSDLNWNKVKITKTIDYDY